MSMPSNRTVTISAPYHRCSLTIRHTVKSLRYGLPVNGGRYFADAVTLEACDTEWFAVHDADEWSEPEADLLLLPVVAHGHGARSSG
ncbi:hypothetical protein [Streptomyces sp. SA15]|uniref:hypothetical protein n=1 Tax=Streptomyces sp. SA15 TaxID=934019 RepID=UPI0011813FA9|nr:hypothetical protein [Streptomyces sp. SA15]